MTTVLLLSILITFSSFASAARVRVLYQNDLSATSTTSALLLGDPTPASNVSAACAIYNEQPLGTVTDDVRDQLAYLVFTGELNNSSSIWLSGNSSTAPAMSGRFSRRWFHTSALLAYNVGSQSASNVDSTEQLPVLCTNSPAPYDSENTAIAPGSLVTLSGNDSDFQGYRDARSFRFLGIPFAAAPVGNLRFQPAQPYNGSYANVNATSYGNQCIQNTTQSGPTFTNSTYSEDCLNLNVYTPALPSNSSDLLPVAFWIFGGAFTSGSNSPLYYDGGNFASRGDVVVVTINYRLGLLGNLASQNLPGSQGTTDQIQALKWVQQHIATFGGDPNKVTIWGQSAGAQSVVALLSSTPAKGLFHGAISESAPWNPFVSRSVWTGPDGIYPAVLNITNCTTEKDGPSQLACLQAIPAQQFASNGVIDAVTAASAAAQNVYSGVGVLTATVEAILPTIGTGVIDDTFVNLVRNGTLPGAGIPLLIGNVENEAVLFVDSVPALSNPQPYSAAILGAILPEAFNNATIAAITSNPTLFAPNTTDPDGLRDFAAEIQTLYVWQCPLQQLLGYAYDRNVFSSLYSFRFDKGNVVNLDYPSACTPSAPSGVQSICHGNDILEVFGTSNVVGFSYNETNSLPFTQYTVDVWTSFVRTGNPQPDPNYLVSRGRSYNGTLESAQAAPFSTFNPNSTDGIHIMDLPPRNSGLLFPNHCQVLANAGFNYNLVMSSS